MVHLFVLHMVAPMCWHPVGVVACPFRCIWVLFSYVGAIAIVICSLCCEFFFVKVCTHCMYEFDLYVQFSVSAICFPVNHHAGLWAAVMHRDKEQEQYECSKRMVQLSRSPSMVKRR